MNRIGFFISRVISRLVLLSLGFSAIALADGMERAAQTAAMLCAACHGETGNSALPANPVLAGQLAETLHTQLNDFQSDGEKPAARKNEVMNSVSAALSNEDRRALSIYFSRQIPATLPITADKKILAGSRLLWLRGDFGKGIPACTGCHGPAGMGVPAQNPRLAGQHSEYTETQLKNYRSEERTNDRNEVMRMIAQNLSDGQIKALSDYIAALH
ncbi:MAG: c-type cytochrome [Candidatus Accumulibacter sp.]|jgi:cytochrome c553|nr:c-type cytochrome [Accumulibacter sp.]